MSVWDEPCVIAPSLIACADMCNLERSVRALEAGGVRALHLDVLDGHFSPCMPLGLDAIRALRKITGLAFDVHLMSTANDFFIGELLDIGCEQLVFHVETEPHIARQLRRIRAAGARAGLALKPATSLSALDYALDECDAVLLMLINPGYAHLPNEGQIPYAARKIGELRQRIRRAEANTKIVLDGRISRQNILDFGASGLADVFVAGGTCLSKANLAASAAELMDFRCRILSAQT